jgi:hypothetical protein
MTQDDMQDATRQILAMEDQDLATEHLYVAAKRFVRAFELEQFEPATDIHDYATPDVSADSLAEAVERYNDACDRLRKTGFLTS